MNMTPTSFHTNRHSFVLRLLPAVLFLFSLASCTKWDEGNKNGNQPSFYSTEVLDKWMSLQLRLMRNATGIPNHAFSRHFVYAGVAAMESLAPGMPAHKQWSAKWNGLSNLPVAAPAEKFYYPANVNAVLAAINKALFPNAALADKQAIDSLEAAIMQHFPATVTAKELTASVSYGKAVAAAVYAWSESD